MFMCKIPLTLYHYHRQLIVVGLMINLYITSIFMRRRRRRHGGVVIEHQT